MSLLSTNEYQTVMKLEVLSRALRGGKKLVAMVVCETKQTLSSQTVSSS